MNQQTAAVPMTDAPSDHEGVLSARWVPPLTLALVFIGTLSRLAPLADPHGRLLRQFMTEDGYLMQTIARNFALGHGLTVSDGTIPTNGVQPLATILFAFFHYLAGGDRSGGIAGVTVFSVLVSLAAAWSLYLLARRLLTRYPDGRLLAMLVAGLWFASPTIVKHSMNGLETGLYFLASLATLNLYASFAESNPNRFSLKQMIAMGVMFGVCFLVRNDAAFLIAAILVARLILRWPKSASLWWDRILEATIPGLVSIAIALPWLIYNYRLFGSVVPISGISESLNAHFGTNLVEVPAPLWDFTTLIFPIPISLRTKIFTILVSVAVVVPVVIVGARQLWSQAASARLILIAYGILGALLVLFYGAYFGASYFMSRYLSVLSPALALAGVTVAYRILKSLSGKRRSMMSALIAPLAAILVVGLNARLYRNGMEHEHFQVVDWIDAHVPPQMWVGAIQSGTLGYFHDRTINLDGKVNPDALRARLNEGDVIAYVLRSDIMYLADWADLAEWSGIEKDGFNRKFELIVADRKENLAVLRRVDAAPR